MKQNRKTFDSENQPQKPAAQAQMPVPTSFGPATDGPDGSSEEMPIPTMLGAEANDPMPRPTGAMTATVKPTASSTAGGQMPIPSFGNGHGGPASPRFISPDLPEGQTVRPSYEPGTVEVQFREGISPNVLTAGPGAPAQIRSAAEAPMDEVNRVLQRYQLVSAEPTLLTTHEEATAAQATARSQGIDAPHLAHFVTLHFPNEANVHEIAAELSQLDQVERAVAVPTALPPDASSVSLPRPPQTQPRTKGRLQAPQAATGTIAPAPLEEAPAEIAPPVSGALAEPLVGTSDQVVLDHTTGLENQWYIFRCKVNKAWARSSARNVVIADVDWGCRTSHQDLAANIKKTYNAYDGTTDVTHGGSVFHGTGVMGLTGAAVNGKGLAGIGFEATLWPVQADSGTGTALGGNSWARGIDWVRTTDSGGKRKVVILEVQTGAFGNYEQVPSVNAAIKTAIAAGVVVCVAAGNGNKDAGLDDSGNAIPETGSILVGATAYDNAINKRAWFSNYGPRV
ncbi:MAG: S8 family serine peptidase, partial [Limisphaerales bacterium]